MPLDLSPKLNLELRGGLNGRPDLWERMMQLVFATNPELLSVFNYDNHGEFDLPALATPRIFQIAFVLDCANRCFSGEST